MRTLSMFLLPALLLACEGDVPAPGAPGSEQAAWEVEGPVLAEVGGIPVTVAEFQAAAAREMPRNGMELTVEEKKAILDDLVDEKLIYLEAKKRGIERDPKVQTVMRNTLLRQDVYSNVRNSDFTPEELRAYYEEHKDEFIVPERLQIRRIFLKGEPTRTDAEAKALAEDLHRRVAANPESFADVASEHSEDPYRRRGGEIGFIPREGKAGVDDEVVENAFTLEVGQVSEPFEAGGGWNIVLVGGKREQVERTFEQMKGSVLRKVKSDRYKELYDAYVAQIRPSYDVSVDTAALESVEITPARRTTVGSRMPARFPGAGEAEVEIDEPMMVDEGEE